MRREFLVGQVLVSMRSLINCRSGSEQCCKGATTAVSLCLAEGPAQGLAQMLTVGGIVQCIVRQLECDAQPLSEPEQRLL